jgi:hypothetical protein
LFSVVGSGQSGRFVFPKEFNQKGGDCLSFLRKIFDTQQLFIVVDREVDAEFFQYGAVKMAGV